MSVMGKGRAGFSKQRAQGKCPRCPGFGSCIRSGGQTRTTERSRKEWGQRHLTLYWLDFNLSTSLVLKDIQFHFTAKSKKITNRNQSIM
jgi:hypothetical protein